MKNIKYYKKFRLKIIEHLGGKCCNCGSSDLLEIDHVDPNKKNFNVSEKWSHSWDSILDEINKCQLLCEDCHKLKHLPDHGTLGRYVHSKCRCTLCKSVWNLKTKEYKIKSKKPSLAQLVRARDCGS